MVEDGAELGQGTVVWHQAHIRSGARVGAECTIGRNAFVDAGVVVGDNCKVQNNALLYHPARLGDGVFIGPAAVLTNDRVPRAVNPDGSKQTADDWDAAGVEVGDGAAIGAGAVVVSGVRIGRWALVAAGAVVAAEVPAFALVAGVPARRLAWVGRTGARLAELGAGRWRCPDTGTEFQEDPASGWLEEIDGSSPPKPPPDSP
jgi:acetyltransferase-like isoleucine patch superfamily enzyme